MLNKKVLLNLKVPFFFPWNFKKKNLKPHINATICSIPMYQRHIYLKIQNIYIQTSLSSWEGLLYHRWHIYNANYKATRLKEICNIIFLLNRVPSSMVFWGRGQTQSLSLMYWLHLILTLVTWQDSLSHHKIHARLKYGCILHSVLKNKKSW